MNNEYKSPEYVQINPAAALVNIHQNGRKFLTADSNFLELQLDYPGGCRATCSYCRFSSNIQGHDHPDTNGPSWPVISVDEIISLAKGNTTPFERICLSMVVHPNAYEDTVFLINRLRREADREVSVLVNPSVLHDGDIEGFHAAGADRAVIAIETATRHLFMKHRSLDMAEQWEKFWQNLSDAIAIFGGDKTGVHFIAGLGETEEEMVNSIQRVSDLGTTSYLFSFYPEPGSIMKDSRPCPAGQFRRIQLARFLIEYSLAVASQMEFDEDGRITGFGIRGTELDEIVDTGEPFTASGCPGKKVSCACKSPKTDGLVNDFRSYQFSVTSEDIQQVRKEMATYMEIPGLIE